MRPLNIKLSEKGKGDVESKKNCHLPPRICVYYTLTQLSNSTYSSSKTKPMKKCRFRVFWTEFLIAEFSWTEWKFRHCVRMLSVINLKKQIFIFHFLFIIQLIPRKFIKYLVLLISLSQKKEKSVKNF